MGSSFGVKIDFSGPKIEERDLDEHHDDRRRNSLAFYISQFVQYEAEDYTKLVDSVRADKHAKTGGKQPTIRGSKFGKIADAILQGNMKECRNQTVVHFGAINRKYKDHNGGNTILHMACQEGYYNMITFMANPQNHSQILDTNELEIGVKNDKERTPLFLCFTPPSATYCGLKFGVNEDGNPRSEKPEELEMITDWVRPGGPKARENCIKFLIENGADVNEKDFHDFTVLHYATMWGWMSTVKLLLEAGADVNAVTIAGKTPLMYAVELNYEGLVILFANHPRININTVDNDGASALIHATEKTTDNAFTLCKILLQAGADPNILTNRRKTALKIACQSQNMAKVTLLLDFKAQKRNSAFNLLEEESFLAVTKRVADDERRMIEEANKQEKLREEQAKSGYVDNIRRGGGGGGGGVTKSPWGAWVEYIDKRTKTSFYYNTVTRNSQRDKPRDFKPDKNRVIKEVIYGMSFYH